MKVKQNIALFNKFDHITCGDDEGIKFGKPNPDLYIKAWEKFGNPNLKQCLVFEDAFHGIQAAISANMNVGLHLYDLFCIVYLIYIYLFDYFNRQFGLTTKFARIILKMFQ